MPAAPATRSSPADTRPARALLAWSAATAGTVEGFRRYSPALKGADVVWNEATLDAWIADPQAFLPGNRMVFRGLPDAQARADLIAYLVQAEHQTAEAFAGRHDGHGRRGSP